jgi:hypothetical protein
MAAIAAILAGVGIVLSGAAPAAGRPVGGLSLEYSCKSPGWRQIPARVTVSIPQTATVGQPIQPARPGIIISVPQADTRRLARMKSSTVTVAAQFRTDVAQNSSVLDDPWLLSPQSAPVPRAGRLRLRLRGAVQPVVVRTPGDITFTAVGLSLRLTPHKLGISATSPAVSGPAALRSVPTRSAASSPAAIRSAGVDLACTLDPGQSARLATVPVMAATGRGVDAPTSPGSWQAGPGGSFSGSSKRVVLKDATTGTVIACKSSSISGTLKSGHELPAAGIGSIPSVTVQTCTGPGGRTFTVATSASASHPWLLNAQSFDTTSNVTTVTISGIVASVSGLGCSATVAGPSSTAPGMVEGANSITAFPPPPDTLSIGPGGGTLHLWNVSGCSGLFSGGDALTFTATYDVTSSQGGGIYVVPTSCPPFPVKNGFPFNPHLKLPPSPPGSTITFPQPPNQSCAFIGGYTNARKIGEAALVGPGFGNIQDGKRIVVNPKANDYVQIDSSGKLYFKPCPGSAPQCRPINGLPPAHATFLSFGFLPTTATLQITQVGTLNIATISTENTLRTSKIESLASIRIENVLVNGTPLSVGSDCRTIRPFKLALTGKPPYQLQTGGVITGNIDIPPFAGCGVGENLDPIFDAAVSGPGNFVKLTQGSLCSDWPVPPFPVGCPATVPKPIH